MDNGDPALPVLCIGQKVWWVEGPNAYGPKMVVRGGQVVSFDTDTICVDVGMTAFSMSPLRFIVRDVQLHETEEHALASIDPENTVS